MVKRKQFFPSFWPVAVFEAGALGDVTFEIHQLIFKHTLVHINTVPWIFLSNPYTPTHNLVSYMFVLSTPPKKGPEAKTFSVNFSCLTGCDSEKF